MNPSKLTWWGALIYAAILFGGIAGIAEVANSPSSNSTNSQPAMAYTRQSSNASTESSGYQRLLIKITKNEYNSVYETILLVVGAIACLNIGFNIGKIYVDKMKGRQLGKPTKRK